MNLSEQIEKAMIGTGNPDEATFLQTAVPQWLLQSWRDKAKELENKPRDPVATVSHSLHAYEEASGGTYVRVPEAEWWRSGQHKMQLLDDKNKLREQCAEKDRESEELRRQKDELREDRDKRIAAISVIRDELEDERQRRGWAESNRDMALSIKNDYYAELSRLKSSEQWAVTCEGMCKGSATRYAGLMREYLYQGRDNWRAVPFAAKEEGPWVLACRNQKGLWTYIARGGGSVFSANDPWVKTFDTFDDAVEYCHLTSSQHIPVRLSDVQAN